MLDPDYLYDTSARYRTLLDNIRKGIDQEIKKEQAGDHAAAAVIGLGVWDELRELMTLLEATHMGQMDSVTTYDLPYWAACLSDELSAATFKSEGFAEMQLAYCKSYIEMHEGLLDKEIGNLGNLRNDLASAYCARGETDIADALYEEWLGAEPEWGFGWIGWADHYSFGRWEAALKIRDLDKAERILKRGSAVKNVSDRDVMEERLERVQEEKVNDPKANLASGLL